MSKDWDIDLLYQQTIAKMLELRDPISKEKRKHFGIDSENSLGLTQAQLKEIAKGLPKNKKLAILFYKSGIYDAKLLTSKIFPASEMDLDLMEEWVENIETWEECDAFCMNVFCFTPWRVNLAMAWVKNESEFVRRAGFVLMACAGLKKVKANTDEIVSYLKLIESYSFDERNFVKKAINWALRQIGKRNEEWKKLALETAHTILNNQPQKGAQWIAKDAIRELTK